MEECENWFKEYFKIEYVDFPLNLGFKDCWKASQKQTAKEIFNKINWYFENGSTEDFQQVGFQRLIKEYLE